MPSDRSAETAFRAELSREWNSKRARRSLSGVGDGSALLDLNSRPVEGLLIIGNTQLKK